MKTAKRAFPMEKITIYIYIHLALTSQQQLLNGIIDSELSEKNVFREPFKFSFGK